jgi:hypothetical protein
LRISHSAARNRYKDLLLVREHSMLLDEALGLLRNPFEIMFLA